LPGPRWDACIGRPRASMLGSMKVTLAALSLWTASWGEVRDWSAWRHARRLVFNTSASGAGVADPVKDFPVLVRLDAANFDFSEAGANGADLGFSDPDGATLAFAIERWDAGARKAEIWVKVPQVDGNSVSDHVVMHWGNPAYVPAPFDTSEVFSSGF